MKERWKQIVGHEGSYEVSDRGRVRTVKTGIIRKAHVRPDGYAQVNLSKKNKIALRYVHRLVAAAFIGPQPDGLEVCHNNGCRGDNFVGNLRYDTARANQADRVLHGTTLRGEQAPWAKLDSNQVRAIRELKGVASCDAVARMFPVNRTSVKNIWARRTWAHV